MPTLKDVKGDGSLVGAQFFRTGMEHFRGHHEGAGEILQTGEGAFTNPEFPFSFPRCERRHGLVQEEPGC